MTRLKIATFMTTIIIVLALVTPLPAYDFPPEIKKKAAEFGYTDADLAKAAAGKILTKYHPRKTGVKAEHFSAIALYNNMTPKQVVAVFKDFPAYKDYFPHIEEVFNK